MNNANPAIDFVSSFSLEYLDEWKDNKDLKEIIDHYFYDFKNFMKNGKTISTTVYYDETAPHIRIMCIPPIYSKDGKKEFFKTS